MKIEIRRAKRNALENIKLLYKSRQVVIKLFNEYSSIASEAKYKLKYGECLKILTSKQMLRRLYILCIEQKKSLKKYIKV